MDPSSVGCFIRVQILGRWVFWWMLLGTILVLGERVNVLFIGFVFANTATIKGNTVTSHELFFLTQNQIMGLLVLV